MNEQHPNYQRQLELELEMVARGVTAEQRRMADAKAAHRESHTGYGSYLVKKAVVPVAQGIRAFLARTSGGKVGRKHIAVKYLRQVDPEVAAFIALRAALDSISIESRLQKAAIRIGTMIETEARLLAFEGENKEAFKRAEQLTKHSAHEGYKRKVFAYIARDNGVEWQPWPETDKFHLGQKLLEIIMEVTGYITILEYRKGMNISYRVIGTEKCLNWIEKRAEHTELFSPEYLPTIIPPKPWDSPYGGATIPYADRSTLLRPARRTTWKSLPCGKMKCLSCMRPSTPCRRQAITSTTKSWMS